MRRFLQYALSRRIALNSVRISLVVGSILNMINQGPRVWHGDHPSWLHVGLNYLVPFCVATYSAVRNEIDQIKK